MKKSRFLVLSFALVLTSHVAHAQMRGWEVGGWAGISNYFGDLNTNGRINRLHLAGGIATRYNFNDRLCFRFMSSVTEVSASDADSDNPYEQKRNLQFKSTIVDGTAQLEFNFLPYVHGSRDFFFTPYLLLGPSIFHFDPKAELNGKTYRLRDLGTEGQFRGEEYSTTQGAIAYGMGFKMDFSYRWSLNVEFSARKLFTDYIDDVHGEYADIRDILAQRGEVAAALADRSGDPPIGLPGRQRGNGKNSDAYVLLGVGVNYYFGQIRCPGILR